MRGFSLCMMGLSTPTLRAAFTPSVVCVIDSTYGDRLWSSSENSQYYARNLYTSNGNVNRVSKDGSNTGRRVRAFLDSSL